MTESAFETVDVELPDRTYPIRIGEDLLRREDAFGDVIAGRDVFVVSDTRVAGHYLERLFDALGSTRVQSHLLEEGEDQKTLANWSAVLDQLAAGAFNRDAVIVALGGGVVGDLAGFAAASYQRGISFVQVPTTLLAQVDASVGGKTGVNHPVGKNLVGAFHQPLAVIADVTTLATLDDRQYRSGIAEVVKYGVGLDAEFFKWLDINMPGLVNRDPAVVVEAVGRCCRIKADIVAADEREAGCRALLNLGHTFGHAIETATGFGQWLHGEAVSMGLVLAARLSRELALIDGQAVERVRCLLDRAGLPVEPPPIDIEQIISLMQMDKKVKSGRTRFIVIDALGRSRVTDEISVDQLRRVLCEARGDAAN
jgi:3-dehydroquinate synthase